MVENKNNNIWSPRYSKLVERNIGIVSIVDQERIRTTKIAVLGVGGLGGPLAEQLIRSGSEHIVICDFDKFDLTNLNRQVCTSDDIGRYKIDVLEEFLLKINSDAEIRKFYEVDEGNISNMLDGVSIVCLTLDDPISSILIARECRKRGIPMLENFGIPYVAAWWFTSDSSDYESCYEFNTHDKSMKEIQAMSDEVLHTNLRFISKIFTIPGMKETYEREKGSSSKMISGEISVGSFAPIIRMSASYLAINCIFAGILGTKQMVLAPNFEGYDYLRNKIIKTVF